MKPSDPLNGLRGLAAVHVMTGHYASHILRVSGGLFVTTEVTLFFLLSGYCLTLRYSPTMDAKKFDTRTFLINRFCRLAPIYWLVNLVMLVAEIDYYDDNIFKKNSFLYIFLSLSCTNTWFYNPWGLPYRAYPISSTSWTVNTLFFFYLTFPTLLKLLKPLSDKSIARLIVLLCLFQSLPFYVVWDVYFANKKLYWAFYNVVILTPIPRLPVFIIGILGGLQTLRWRESLECQKTLLESQKKPNSALWRTMADFGGFVYVAFVTICAYLSNFAQVGQGYQYFRWSMGYSNLFVVPLQLTMILGLARSHNTSILAKICNTCIVQFLGNISMVLYLIHLDQLAYVSMLTSMFSKEEEYTLPTKIFTHYQIFFGLTALSIFLSWIILKTFVNPLGKGLKKHIFHV